MHSHTRARTHALLFMPYIHVHIRFPGDVLLFALKQNKITINPKYGVFSRVEKILTLESVPHEFL